MRFFAILALLCAAGSAAGAGMDSPLSSDGPSMSTVAQGVLGVVTTADGAPIAGVFVAATALDASSGPIPDIGIVTDATGRFAWPMKPGRYRLTFVLNGREVARRDVVVEADSATNLTVSAGR